MVAALESDTIPASEFTHVAHIAAALNYLARLTPDQALVRMRAKIPAFAVHHGADHLYHETLTRFWMRLLGHLSAIYHVDLPLWRRINLIVDRWGTRLPVDAHYSRELITSAAARATWMQPDRLPLPF